MIIKKSPRYAPNSSDYSRYQELDKYLLIKFRKAFLNNNQKALLKWMNLIHKNNKEFQEGFLQDK